MALDLHEKIWPPDKKISDKIKKNSFVFLRFIFINNINEQSLVREIKLFYPFRVVDIVHMFLSHKEKERKDTNFEFGIDGFIWLIHQRNIIKKSIIRMIIKWRLASDHLKL